MAAKETAGQRISRRRKELNLTQRALARRAGVSAISVWRYEHDEMDPRMGVLERIAKELKSSVDWIMKGRHQPAPTAAPRGAAGKKRRATKPRKPVTGHGARAALTV